MVHPSARQDLFHTRRWFAPNLWELTRPSAGRSPKPGGTRKQGRVLALPSADRQEHSLAGRAASGHCLEGYGARWVVLGSVEAEASCRRGDGLSLRSFNPSKILRWRTGDIGGFQRLASLVQGARSWTGFVVVVRLLLRTVLLTGVCFSASTSICGGDGSCNCSLV